MPIDQDVPQESAEASPRRPLEPLDPQLTSIQPGGGFVMRIELAWGHVRRCYLKRFRRRYVERMRQARRGDPRGCPHDVLDPRDVKFYRNQQGHYWLPEDDPFRWRDRLPFARPGLAELLLIGGGALVLSLGLAFVWWPAAIVPAVLGLFVAWFFRDPERRVPSGSGVVVAPADGKVVAIEEIDHDELLGGPAVLIGIFLSVFNVHVNRAPVKSRVLGLSYRRGKFLNALRPESARENEQLEIRLEEVEPPFRVMRLRQIAGAIARRIVCWVAPGDQLARGERCGMIKLGSRTELVLPRKGLELSARLGQTVKAGRTELARYHTEDAGSLPE